ncbi:hypothetical protein Vqi01_16500 [Micromonospora qiuiae]|uniref:von Hippel-Lindau disease tumour suppressor beta domain-containing protein n=1 Tax=Micromonospora qiuiae TaxID=502268 RepID=A0ABQ4J8J0_9ACTN|nr:hypothetical protein [Micromonospora qiuiae]GIJ26488.1 hypothetical protein Vqi01_16500 [Micromonospora qiuiae]
MAPVVRDSRSQTPPVGVRQSTVIPVEPAHRGEGRTSHRLMLAGVAAAVLSLLLTALWPAAQPAPVADADGPAGWLGPSPVGLSSAGPLPRHSASPSAASSVGGVSAVRPERPGQISAPARLPSPSAAASRTAHAPAPSPGKPSFRPTTPPSRPARPPKATQPAQLPQLSPLPGWRERHLRSVSGGAETSIEFVNLRSRPVVLYWLDHHGQRRQYAVIPPSASHRQHTYVGHPWVVTDRRGRALACFEPIRTPARAEIR